MYNDDVEYLNFLKSKNVNITTEDILSSQRTHIDPINPNLDWHDIGIQYAKNHVVVIDDFLITDYAIRLRDFMLFFNKKEDFYDDYAAVNFRRNVTNNVWYPLLSDIVDEVKMRAYCLRTLSFERAWAFIYNNNSNGVNIHADAAAINLNFWVTPDECIIHSQGKNGLDIWKIYPPKDWNYSEYNRNADKSAIYISQHDVEKVSVSYKFNRLIMFDSMFFHKTQPVQTKDGYENRRINYTFLYR